MDCRHCGKDTKAPQNPGNNPGKWIVFENGLSPKLSLRGSVTTFYQ